VIILLSLSLAILAGPAPPVQASKPAASKPPASKPAAKQTQDPKTADLQKKYEEKLKEPFFSKAPWFTDYDKALAEAKKSGKLVFGYFSRSYAY
jgi:hypothetical protein